MVYHIKASLTQALIERHFMSIYIAQNVPDF